MTMHFTKLSFDEEARLLQLFDVQEQSIKQAFLQFIRDTKSDAAMREILGMLERNLVDDAIQYVNSYLVRVGNTVAEAFRQSAQQGVEDLSGKVVELNPRVVVSFDQTSPRIIQIMSENKLEFIREFSETQRQATRMALAEAISQGLGVRQTATRFRQSIGLTTNQLVAVDNYRRLLETGSAQALDRSLRDRRFDSSVRRSINDGRTLTAEQIDRMVARYEERYLIYRSENIARTETVSAVSQGYDEAFRQVLDQTGIDTGRGERIWHVNIDGRERDWHEVMDGQVVGIDEPFVDGLGNKLFFPGDKKAPANTRISCRCSVTYRIRDAT